jgi:dolichol-phosphate mannosyltransferase
MNTRIDKNALFASISKLDGPIVVTGAGGFIGSNLVSALSKQRADIYSLARRRNWRLSALDNLNLKIINLENKQELINYLNQIRPRTVFNLAAHGAYHDQSNVDSMTTVNFSCARWIADWCADNQCGLVQAGTSSEYGTNCAGPKETDICQPNSAYAVTKLAATQAIELTCRSSPLSATVLRLYSVYGPMEEPKRLIPTLIRSGYKKELPPFSPRDVTRDDVYIDDTIEALVLAAVSQVGKAGFRIFNVCSGTATSLEQVATIAKEHFQLGSEPSFGPKLRSWDLEKWFGNPENALKTLGWSAETSFAEGFKQTEEWYRSDENRSFLDTQLDSGLPSQDRKKISAIIACYKDSDAIPEMYKRLVDVFTKINVDYEIIFVNDCSPDNSLHVIENISSSNLKVSGITHSRNFGSQAAFLSGMSIATGDACVLLDGDLQDPPELIEKFVEQWDVGFDVVFGRRVGREAPILMNLGYKAFYRLLAKLSTFEVPLDAGDFSLVTKKVVNQILRMPERELFLRANRAFVGHRQCGIDYVRPERKFGKSTNNLRRNIGWAFKGVVAVGRAPLSLVSIIGATMFGLSLVAIVGQLLIRIVYPNLSPPGFASTLTAITFFGAINLLGISIIGSYVGRILDESKRRPRFITATRTVGGRTEVFDRVDVDDE